MVAIPLRDVAVPAAPAVERASVPRSRRVALSLPHGLKVALRAGGATLAAGAITALVAPAAAPVVAMAAGAAAIAFELTRMQITIGRALHELTSEIAQTQPLIDLVRELPTERPLPAMQGYAIAPDFALMLARMIADEKPELILETGSGVSTLVAAYALQRLGRGKVVALEHEPAYAEKTRALIAQHGLSDYATIVDAPLEPIELDGTTYRWYATRALDGLGPIDMVIDDGPPRCAGDMLRYASLPVLSKRMALRATFVLDVVGEEEKIILERWRHELPAFAQEHLATKKGNVIIRRAPQR